MTEAGLEKGEVARGEPSIVPLDLVAELEAGRDADVREPIGSVLRAKRSACRIECAHAGDVLLSGGELIWIDAANHGLWVVEASADQEGSLAFKPSSPRAIASEILQMLPRT